MDTKVEEENHGYHRRSENDEIRMPNDESAQICGQSISVFSVSSAVNLRSGEADLDRRIGLLRIHDYGLVRLHIDELVLDVL